MLCAWAIPSSWKRAGAGVRESGQDSGGGGGRQQSGPGACTHLQLIVILLGGQTATTRSIQSCGEKLCDSGACSVVTACLPLTLRSHAWAPWPRNNQLGSSPHGKVGPGGAGGPPGGEDSHGAIVRSGEASSL